MADDDEKIEAKKAHRLEKEIEIAASVEEVWAALTDPKKLVNWFPLDARVAPGKDGTIFVSWGPDCEGEAPIIEWEPGRKFAWKEMTGAVVEFTLEARGGKTLVRLVHSGFLTGADWENEWFESTNYGWDFMLLSLRVLLERHRGEERKVAWQRLAIALTRAQAYEKLLQPGELFREVARVQMVSGQQFSLTSASGEKLSGNVELVRAPRGMCLRVAEWNEALLWVTLEGKDGKLDAQVWISTFGLPQSRVDELNNVWGERLKSVFA
jgi:uncharacterized protein YndB with AHSA1/START domain